MRTTMSFLFACLAIGTSCSNTKVTRTWKDPAASTAQLDDVLVVATVKQEERSSPVGPAGLASMPLRSAQPTIV